MTMRNDYDTSRLGRELSARVFLTKETVEYKQWELFAKRFNEAQNRLLGCAVGKGEYEMHVEARKPIKDSVIEAHAILVFDLKILFKTRPGS